MACFDPVARLKLVFDEEPRTQKGEERVHKKSQRRSVIENLQNHHFSFLCQSRCRLFSLLQFTLSCCYCLFTNGHVVDFNSQSAFSILVFVVDIMIGFSLYCTSWYLRYNIALLWFFISNMLLSISHHSHQFKYMTIPLLEASYSWF